MIPTSAGPTALIGDPGPQYRHSCDLTGFMPADSIEWPFPVTDRARVLRALMLVGRIAPRLTEAWRQVARDFARAGQALGAAAQQFAEERQEAV